MTKSYIYTDKSRILAQRNGGQAAAEYFYLTDRLGSVRQLIDDTGSVVRNYTYSPFGQLLEEAAAGGAPANRFMFTGQWFDDEIEQYYLRARMYDPNMMRFTARDPYRGKPKEPLSVNLYLYCQNNSINATDPDGRYLGLICGVGIGSEMYAEDAAVGALALGFASHLLIQNHLRNDTINIVIAGVASGVGELIDFGLTAHAMALNKFGEMKGGKQSERDQSLWKYKPNFKNNPSGWRKFKKFIEKLSRKQGGKDLTVDEITEAYDDFIQGLNH